MIHYQTFPNNYFNVPLIEYDDVYFENIYDKSIR